MNSGKFLVVKGDLTRRMRMLSLIRSSIIRIIQHKT